MNWMLRRKLFKENSFIKGNQWINLASIAKIVSTDKM